MSIERLPNELLIQIFSYFSSRELIDSLSLVNQRWNRVIVASKTALQISKVFGEEGEKEINNTIPYGVLSNSSREYTTFRCSLKKMNAQMLKDTFEKWLQFCKHRWNMNHLRIDGYTAQIIFILRHYQSLLSSVAILVVDLYQEAVFWLDDTPQNPEYIAVTMENLQRLCFGLPYPYESYKLTLRCPNLETLDLKDSKHFRFELRDCPKLQSVKITNILPQEPVKLASILPQYPPSMTRIKLKNFSVVDHVKTMFETAQYISLENGTLLNKHPLNSSNLIELELVGLDLSNPLVLNAPQLRTLICDSLTLAHLHLEGAVQAERLVIEDGEYLGRFSTLKEGLSHFRVLELRDSRIAENAERFTNLWQPMGNITELVVHMFSGVLEDLPKVLAYLPQVTSLRLQRTDIPNDVSYLAGNLQKIIIDDCSTDSNSIMFSPTIRDVLVRELWQNTKTNARILLLPQDKFLPLDSTTIWLYGQRYMIYTTR